MKDWWVLAASSGIAGWAFNRLGVPAAWMVGPMVAAILFGLVTGRRPRVRRPVFAACQAVVGVIVASMFRASDLPVIVHHLPAVVLVAAGSLLVSLIIGWAIGRFAHVDRMTAVLGAMPGGASGMVAMSVSLQADPKLVAVMQYVRVISVVLTASAMTRWLAGSAAHVQMPASLAQGGYVLHSLETLAVGLVGAWLGLTVRLPAGQLLGAILAGTVANLAGWVPLTIPGWMSAVAYAVLGVYVGLMFDRASLKHAGLLLPYIFASTVALILLCAAIGWGMARWTGETLLTGLLATSPGGLDSVSLMAIGGGANLALVVSLQTVRMFTIVFCGPPIVRWLARREGRVAHGEGAV
ncbi:MAG: AbrB family transcriptional regulator [Alicyclobacillus macrosporangiidus]|uniref:AbrB family transcriptional regulator n=1 Tax=Alicyclobacillus macrosporangiidus TaxID=392015 RepID=UPI0026F0F8F3|nr:AbrB family transcriptional regulator [Alicyclobacillus macrosporangiidus]MCL6599433.1 AbrB family transcriptional regulator [Alicyclobacillus macrosporangiidus]